ncbi:MAG TPA: hypothetical protein ENL09_00440 [Bacteroidetes bacterium]|nr:MAG: hypothetical protein DRH24_08690 [Deltaproteobacteria bacterium]HHE64473.1 hypothetical protein [Bacteroidota bacterium]
MIKEQIGFLVKLQTIETETLNIKSLISDACKKLDKVDADLKEFEKTIAQEESLMDEQKKKCRSYESDLESNLSQIKKSQEKLSSIKTNREYKSLLKETEELKTKSSQIENEIIACLDLIEKTEKSILTKKNDLKELKEHAINEKQNIMKENELKIKKLAELDTKWNKFTKKVKPELLKKFMTIKDLSSGTALASVNNSVCSGCNLNIPPQLYNELQRCDSLKFCPHCQRIIYWKESKPLF